VRNQDFREDGVGVPAGFTYHPEYVDTVVDRFSRFVGNKVTFIRIMGTTGMLCSTCWANTVFNTKVIQELFKELNGGDGYIF
jgi:hypothetical protein